MKTVKARITTTHVDRHGDRMMLSALESALEHYRTKYIPVGIEHDPRIPPQGRVVSVEIVALDDGHYALDADIEMFEAGDQPPLEPGGREIPVGRFGEHPVTVMSDRQLREQRDQEDIMAIADALDGERSEEIKKALEPIAILTIAGTFVLGAFATGFLSRVGEDAYDAAKQAIKRLFARRNQAAEETLLRLVLEVEDRGRVVEVEIIASRPDNEAIDRLFGAALVEIESLLPSLLASSPDLRRFVFEYSNQGLHLSFAVRRDAMPLFPARRGGA
jgi:hypothetical protein